MIGSNTLRVETEVLKQQSEEVENAISQLQGIFDDIETVIFAIDTYWEGDGAEMHKKVYRERMEAVDEIYKRFRENVNDLREMAGIYENTETINKSEAEVLPSDVIA